MWRYKRISKNLEDYTVRRFGDIVEVRSLDKKKLYQLIVSKDFLRLEFIIAFEKLNEFFSELRVLNYYFEGALTPLMWKLSECGKNGDCRTNVNGLVKGLYNIITVEGKMMVGVNFKVKSEYGEEKTYADLHPLDFPFKGTASLDRFTPEDKGNNRAGAIKRLLLRLLGRQSS